MWKIQLNLKSKVLWLGIILGLIIISSCVWMLIKISSIEIGKDFCEPGCFGCDFVTEICSDNVKVVRYFDDDGLSLRSNLISSPLVYPVEKYTFRDGFFFTYGELNLEEFSVDLDGKKI